MCGSCSGDAPTRVEIPTGARVEPAVITSVNEPIVQARATGAAPDAGVPPLRLAGTPDKPALEVNLRHAAETAKGLADQGFPALAQLIMETHAKARADRAVGGAHALVHAGINNPHFLIQDLSYRTPRIKTPSLLEA